MLEHILSHEECDVDPVNRLEKATPLHLAVATEDPEVRVYLVESLLEAGADYTFVRLILCVSTITMVTACDMYIGYEINTGRQHLTS